MTAGGSFDFFHITAVHRKEFTDFMDDADSDAESDAHTPGKLKCDSYIPVDKKGMIIKMK